MSFFLGISKVIDQSAVVKDNKDRPSIAKTDVLLSNIFKLRS